MSTRYYRTTDAVYTAVRAALDVAWGHPKAPVHVPTGTPVVTTSCLPAVEDALHDAEGNVLVALPSAWAVWPEVATQLAALTQAGQVTQITEAEYRAALPAVEMP